MIFKMADKWDLRWEWDRDADSGTLRAYDNGSGLCVGFIRPQFDRMGQVRYGSPAEVGVMSLGGEMRTAIYRTPSEAARAFHDRWPDVSGHRPDHEFPTFGGDD